MTVHRCLWWAVLVGGVLPAAMLGMVEAPSIGLAVTISALGLLLGALLSGARWSWAGWGATGTAAMLVGDAAPVLGWSVLVVILLLAGTSREFLRSVRPGHVVGRRDRVAASAGTSYVAACLGTMSGRQLCEAWRASFVGVKAASARDRRIEASVRQSLLDELESRDALRFRDWLDRSPSAASDPLWVVSLPTRLRPARPRRGHAR